MLTLLLGTDDEVDRTSLGGADLYPDLLGALAAIEDRGGHPFRFYQNCGFSLAGVVPDADGTGKPDIADGEAGRWTSSFRGRPGEFLIATFDIVPR